MRCSVRGVVLGLSVLSAAAFSQTQDKVGIRYLPGHPLPARSVELLEVRVERRGASTGVDKQEIDRFFASVEDTLSKYRIDRDWQLVIPDAPSIEIAVDLRGRRLRLASAHVLSREAGDSWS